MCVTLTNTRTIIYFPFTAYGLKISTKSDRMPSDDTQWKRSSLVLKCFIIFHHFDLINCDERRERVCGWSDVTSDIIHVASNFHITSVFIKIHSNNANSIVRINWWSIPFFQSWIYEFIVSTLEQFHFFVCLQICTENVSVGATCKKRRLKHTNHHLTKKNINRMSASHIKMEYKSKIQIVNHLQENYFIRLQNYIIIVITFTSLFKSIRHHFFLLLCFIYCITIFNCINMEKNAAKMLCNVTKQTRRKEIHSIFMKEKNLFFFFSI